MKKKIATFLGAILLSQSLLFGIASAGYVPENDDYIIVESNGKRKNFPLSEETANLMFQRQEELQAKIREITGRDRDYSYIWIVIDGEVVLAVDPPSWVP